MIRERDLILISLLFALAAGYTLGMFVRGKWRPFVLCLPASAVVYLVTKIALSAFTSDGVQLPDLTMFVLVSLLQTPFLMIGAYFARRRQKRDGYEA
jgi:hypothetical protein